MILVTLKCFIPKQSWIHHITHCQWMNVFPWNYRSKIGSTRIYKLATNFFFFNKEHSYLLLRNPLWWCYYKEYRSVNIELKYLWSFLDEEKKKSFSTHTMTRSKSRNLGIRQMRNQSSGNSFVCLCETCIINEEEIVWLPRTFFLFCLCVCFSQI